MAFEIPGFSFTLPAGADLTTHLFKALDVDSSGNAVLASADGRCIGALNNKPNTGEAATVVNSGIAQMVADAAITAGVNLEVGTSGRVRTWATSGVSIGIALEAASGQNSVIAVLLMPTTPAA